MPPSSLRKMTRERMLRFLGELETSSGPAISLYMPAGISAAEIEVMLKTAAIDVSPDVDNLVGRSETGAVLFWGESHRYLVLPPFPSTASHLLSGYQIEPLLSLLQQELIIALVLVRLGNYAIGVFQGEKRISSKVGAGLVHSRHKKGGSSQRRFERHREKQMEYYFDRVCAHAKEHLEPHVQRLDYVIYGGERNTLMTFRSQCRFLTHFDDRTLGFLLNVREPRQATLEAAIIVAWSSRLIEFTE